MTPLEDFISNSDARVALRKVLEGTTMSKAMALLAEMHRPAGEDVYSAGPEHLVRAAAIHDYEAGWHDCLRAFKNLTIAKSHQTMKSLVPFDDEYVKKAMTAMGKPLHEEKPATRKRSK